MNKAEELMGLFRDHMVKVTDDVAALAQLGADRDRWVDEFDKMVECRDMLQGQLRAMTDERNHWIEESNKRDKKLEEKTNEVKSLEAVRGDEASLRQRYNQAHQEQVSDLERRLFEMEKSRDAWRAEADRIQGRLQELTQRLEADRHMFSKTLTIRDHFALAALARGTTTVEECYRIADEMLKVRGN